MADTMQRPVRTKLSGRLPVGNWSHSSGYSCVKDPRIHGNAGTKVQVQHDLPPDRHELFLLDEGEKKVEHEPETRMFHPTSHRDALIMY